MTEYDKCLASAQKSLAMREHSKFQLINKLKNKSFDTDTINSVLKGDIVNVITNNIFHVATDNIWIINFSLFDFLQF